MIFFVCNWRKIFDIILNKYSFLIILINYSNFIIIKIKINKNKCYK
jgi:hypothetical protein